MAKEGSIGGEQLNVYQLCPGHILQGGKHDSDTARDYMTHGMSCTQTGC